MKPADLQLGKMIVDNYRQQRHTVQVVQLAADACQQITLISFVAPQSASRAVATMFNVGGPLSCKNDGASSTGGAGVYEMKPMPGKGRYWIRKHRLDYGMLQATLWLKDPNFIPAYSDDALWLRLSSDAYTTPLLREWVPWLAAEMQRPDLKVLKFDTAFQCNPAHLRATPKFLDSLVEAGIRNKKLTIPAT